MTVERKAAGVPEHVRVRLEDQLGHLSSSLDHSREASSRKRRAALRGEHEGRFRLLLALEPSDRMCAGSALLDPADVQGARPEVDLILAQTNEHKSFTHV
jgi:hypothetical protein